MNAEFLAVDIFGFNQTVAVANERGVLRDEVLPFRIFVVFHDSEDHAALFERDGGTFADAKSRQVACVGVTQDAGRTVVNGDEKCREAVVAGVAHEVIIQTGDKLGGAQDAVDGREQLTAQSRLQAGHQQCGGNSFAGNIGDGDSDRRRVQLNEVVVIAADHARRLADRFQLHTRKQRKPLRKQLILHLARDGNFVLQPLVLLLVFDELVDRVGHQVERFAQHTELVAAFNLYAVGKILGLHEQRRLIKAVDGGSDAAGHYHAGDQSGDFK